MFKTSARRRQIVRDSKARRKKPRTEAQQEAERKYSREYRRKKAHEYNEKRRARRNRHGQNTRIATAELRERFAGMQIVSAASLAKDRTVWAGPKSPRSKQLQEAADAILERAAKMEVKLEVKIEGNEKPELQRPVPAPPSLRELIATRWVRMLRP